MRLFLAYILAALLVLPIHALSYVNAVSHVAHADHEHHHDDEHEADHDHHGTHHEIAQHSVRSDNPNPDFSHRHAPDQPVHSHHMEIWGLFAIQGVPQQPSFAHAVTFKFQGPLIHSSFTAISDPCARSLLRPPIA